MTARSYNNSIVGVGALCVFVVAVLVSAPAVTAVRIDLWRQRDHVGQSRATLLSTKAVAAAAATTREQLQLPLPLSAAQCLTVVDTALAETNEQSVDPAALEPLLKQACESAVAASALETVTDAVKGALASSAEAENKRFQRCDFLAETLTL